MATIVKNLLGYSSGNSEPEMTDREKVLIDLNGKLSTDLEDLRKANAELKSDLAKSKAREDAYKQEKETQKQEDAKREVELKKEKEDLNSTLASLREQLEKNVQTLQDTKTANSIREAALMSEIEEKLKQQRESQEKQYTQFNQELFDLNAKNTEHELQLEAERKKNSELRAVIEDQLKELEAPETKTITESVMSGTINAEITALRAKFIKQNSTLLDIINKMATPQPVTVNIYNALKIAEEEHAKRENSILKKADAVAKSSKNEELMKMLEDQFKEQKEKNEVRTKILSNPILRDFYFTFQIAFNDALLACHAIHSGMIDHGSSTTDKVRDKVLEAGKHIPCLGLIFTILDVACKAIDFQDRKTVVNRGAQFIIGAASIEKIGEDLARELTMKQTDEILKEVASNKSQKKGVFTKAYNKLKEIKNDLTINDINTPTRERAARQCTKLLLAAFKDELKDHIPIRSEQYNLTILLDVILGHDLDPSLKEAEDAELQKTMQPETKTTTEQKQLQETTEQKQQQETKTTGDANSNSGTGSQVSTINSSSQASYMPSLQGSAAASHRLDTASNSGNTRTSATTSEASAASKTSIKPDKEPENHGCKCVIL